MKLITKATLATAVAAMLSPAAFADGRNPGSALIYPIHRSDLGVQAQGGSVQFFTVINVTNINLSPTTGTTNVMYEYVNIIPDPQDPKNPLSCLIFDRVETLTPADTLSVLTSCHNAAGGQEGYLVVHAQDPDLFKTAWSFNFLTGSELCINSLGAVYNINAIPFESPVPSGSATDLDGDGQLDFDNNEYEGVPDELCIDSFIGLANSSLTILNLSGGTEFKATVGFDVFNDNEFPMSATLQFTCWAECRLSDISPVFTDFFLRFNTPNDPAELDTNCDGVGDLETGWAIIDGIVASSPVETIQDPALLGALTLSPGSFFQGGVLLWESTAKQTNGDFLKFGTDDPEN